MPGDLLSVRKDFFFPALHHHRLASRSGRFHSTQGHLSIPPQANLTMFIQLRWKQLASFEQGWKVSARYFLVAVKVEDKRFLLTQKAPGFFFQGFSCSEDEEQQRGQPTREEVEKQRAVFLLPFSVFLSLSCMFLKFNLDSCPFCSLPPLRGFSHFFGQVEVSAGWHKPKSLTPWTCILEVTRRSGGVSNVSWRCEGKLQRGSPSPSLS